MASVVTDAHVYEFDDKVYFESLKSTAQKNIPKHTVTSERRNLTVSRNVVYTLKCRLFLQFTFSLIKT